MFRLMIKEHNTTKLKYLCITKNENYEEYSGSGTYWKKHLDEYGYDFNTVVLYEDEDYERFLEMCIHYSAEFDVAQNEDFANLIPENGYGFDGIFKLEIGSEKRNFILKKMSETRTEWWKDFSPEERFQLLEKFHEGRKKFYEQKGPKYEIWKERSKKNLSDYNKSVSFEEWSERNSKARLSLTPEQKEKRKQKLLANHATGKYDHLWVEMSEKRKGTGNPAAKIIVWYGEEYTKQQFSKLKISKEIFEKTLLERDDCYKKYTDEEKKYEIVVCPYCGKTSGGRKPSVFKRHHLENCKEKNCAKID